MITSENAPDIPPICGITTPSSTLPKNVYKTLLPLLEIPNEVPIK